MNQIPNIEEIEEDNMTPFESQLAQAILRALEYRGFYDCGKYLDTSLIEHIRPLFHHQLQKAKEDMIVSIFSGDTIEYKGKFFKISDQDALSFIEWKQSGLNQNVQICNGYTKIGDAIYSHSELDQDKK